MGGRGEAEGQTGSEMKLQEADVMKSRRSMFKPAEAGTGDGPLPCGKNSGEVLKAFGQSWSALFAGSSFGLAESLLLRHSHSFALSSPPKN